MLHNHEYDPNCKFCCENEFVKQAEKAKAELPSNMNLMASIGDSLILAENKLSEYDLSTINKNIQKFKDLDAELDACSVNMERQRMSIQKNEATIALLTNEICALEAKAKEYEDNREAIENKEQLFGERSAVELKIAENKNMLKKCDSLTKEYLIEEATTKEIIRAIHAERNEYKDVMNSIVTGKHTF